VQTMLLWCCLMKYFITKSTWHKTNGRQANSIQRWRKVIWPDLKRTNRLKSTSWVDSQVYLDQPLSLPSRGSGWQDTQLSVSCQCQWTIRKETVIITKASYYIILLLELLASQNSIVTLLNQLKCRKLTQNIHSIYISHYYKWQNGRNL